MKTLQDKLVKYGFVKLNYFWYFWYIVLQGRGVYKEEDTKRLIYKYVGVGKAKSLCMEVNSIWIVFLIKDTLYISTMNGELYKQTK